jgi:DNA-binding PadR family transcriptional regulator
MWVRLKMEKIIKSYSPMTETAFYILLSLTVPCHGYGIIKHVEELTEGRLVLGSGTIYGTLTKMQRDGIITVYADEKRKTIYEITDVGKGLMRHEMGRLKELYKNAMKQEGEFR